MPLNEAQLAELAAYSRAALARLDAGRQEWAAPVSLDERTAPPLPLPVLPATLRDIVAAVSEYAQTPSDLAYLVAFGCLGAATMKRLRIEGAAGWTEPTNLYAAVVMEPGQRKSEVLRKVADPLYEWERRQVEAQRVAVARAQESRAADERHLVRLRDDVAKGKPLHREADELSERLASTPRPTLPRLIVDDVTPEKLAGLLADHGERLAVISAEGAIFGVNLGRRYGADGAGHFEVYLKAHGGDPLRVDRVKGGAHLIEEPLLDVIVTIQPHVLATASDDDELVGRGLLARFLIAVPESTMGRRSSVGVPIPAPIMEAWRRLLAGLLDCPPPAGTVLHLSAEAREALTRFRDRLEPRLSAALGDLAGISGWAAKLHGAALRVAANLHAVEASEGRAGWGDPVGGGSMLAAVAIAEALIPHAQAAMDRAGGDERADDARTILRWLRREGPARFTERDAYRCWGGRRTVEQVKGAIALLEETGHVRPVETEDEGRAGRKPSPAFEVHPLLSNSGNCGNGLRYTEGIYKSPSLLVPPRSCAEPLPELPKPELGADDEVFS